MVAILPAPAPIGGRFVRAVERGLVLAAGKVNAKTPVQCSEGVKILLGVVFLADFKIYLSICIERTREWLF